MTNKIKVAIIDDEIEYVNDLAKGLEMLGYEVFKATNGTQAIDIIKNNKPNVALCDFKLDDMEGTEIVSRSKSESPETKYIMITGYFDEKYEEIFKKAGAEEVMYKPIMIIELNKKIKKILEGEL